MSTTTSKQLTLQQLLERFDYDTFSDVTASAFMWPDKPAGEYEERNRLWKSIVAQLDDNGQLVDLDYYYGEDAARREKMWLLIGMFLGAAMQWRDSVGVRGTLGEFDYAEAMVELAKNWQQAAVR